MEIIKLNLKVKNIYILYNVCSSENISTEIEFLKVVILCIINFYGRDKLIIHKTYILYLLGTQLDNISQPFL